MYKMQFLCVCKKILLECVSRVVLTWLLLSRQLLFESLKNGDELDGEVQKYFTSADSYGTDTDLMQNLRYI